MGFRELVESDTSILIDIFFSIIVVAMVVYANRNSRRTALDISEKVELAMHTELQRRYPTKKELKYERRKQYWRLWHDDLFRLNMIFLFLLVFATLALLKDKIILHSVTFEPFWYYAVLVGCCWLIFLIIYTGRKRH